MKYFLKKNTNSSHSYNDYFTRFPDYNIDNKKDEKNKPFSFLGSKERRIKLSLEEAIYWFFKLNHEIKIFYPYKNIKLKICIDE